MKHKLGKNILIMFRNTLQLQMRYLGFGDSSLLYAIQGSTKMVSCRVDIYAIGNDQEEGAK